MEEKETITPEVTTEPSVEELEKKLAEAEAKRVELLKAKIEKLESSNKSLEEVNNYTYPNPPTISSNEIIVQPKPVLGARDAIKARFEESKVIMDTYPYGSQQRKNLFNLDEMLPNGTPTIQAFGDGYNNKKDLDDLLFGVRND